MCMGATRICAAGRIDPWDSRQNSLKLEIAGSPRLSVSLRKTRVKLMTPGAHESAHCALVLALRLPALQQLGRTLGRFGLTRRFVERRGEQR
jgi:hypothetical protein